MTKLEKIKILDENYIEHQITKSGELIALVKMSTAFGDDCSDWMDATTVIESIKEQEAYFKSCRANQVATPNK